MILVACALAAFASIASLIAVTLALLDRSEIRGLVRDVRDLIKQTYRLEGELGELKATRPILTPTESAAAS